MTDLFDTTTTVKTRKVSCQYPIASIQDMSSSHTSNQQNNSWTVTTEFPTDDGQVIYQLCRQIIHQQWQQEPVSQVQVTALDPRLNTRQLDLFESFQGEREQVNHVTDDINQRYGEFTLAPARLLDRSSMPNVIAPAWKPYGHRQTIDH